MAARAQVGTSGWNYKHWRELIYQKGLPQRRWLEFYSSHFDTVEVNTSFYKVPKRETVDCWRDATPDAFTFALKVWRGITHYRKLKNAAEFTTNFLEVADALPMHRRAPLLIQLPPNQGKDVEKLSAYLAELLAISTGTWPVAVEFRNAAWLDADTYRVLDRAGVSVCLHDMQGRGATEQTNDAPLVYVRRHGTAQGPYAGSYSPEAIAADASRVRQWVHQGREVYVYYNNDIGGHAFWNARDLKQAVASGG